ncbi:membrane protein insertion efficiency factor YidD [Mycobacterium persicum]|uniref:membrane protein insertion efficiency factor YidD n=1 Tax=Mycobacterium persicum TaxID=1487726 RepID=UPI000A0BC65C|nr:membrane protein insertion efficiency factor YidD [Mycobacterium persicum]ORB95619.1 membrane protein insertion efficiency factor YidD [Mycobacterium persicum]ORC02379.1 membrane protein insertion efficiency factor YidD [Mycobacterium persicum]
MTQSAWSPARVAKATGRWTARGLIFMINLYRHMVSPLRPASCRFVPTCSQYAVDALTEYGLIRGSWLTVARLAKCGPWHRGGWDPIPERRGCSDCDVRGDLPAKQGKSESFV